VGAATAFTKAGKAGVRVKSWRKNWGQKNWKNWGQSKVPE
jgi:hypothetical protein